MRILVINDNDGLLMLCRLALESRGHDVETTTEANAVRNLSTWMRHGSEQFSEAP